MAGLNPSLWQSFFDRNPDFDLLHFDFARPDAAAQLALGENDEAAISVLKALQRLMRVTTSQPAAEALYQAGLSSAHQIAAMPEHQFVRSYSQALSGDGGAEAARQIHRRATNVVEHVRLHAMNALSLNDVSFAASPVVSTAPLNFYNGLPSYEELFGGLNYTQCQECQSILSPAAYFVDLMRLIDGYVSKPGHKRLSLRARRPDLWMLPLDCDSTNEEVPYLQIVNQILEAQVKFRLEAAAKEKNTQMTTADPLARLATSIYPFSLPFNDPLERVRRLLGHFNLSLAEIYADCLVGKAEGDAPGSIAREALQISPEKYSVLTTSDTAGAYLLQAYGMTPDTSLSTLSNAATFRKQTRLDEAQLESLLYQNSRRKRALEFNGSTQVFIGNPAELQITGDLTIEFWLNPANFNARQNPICKCVGGEFAITQETAGSGLGSLLHFYCGDDDSFNGAGNTYLQLDINPNNLLSTNQWTHVAVVRNISGLQITGYINGDQTGTLSIPSSYEIVSSTDNVQIGCGYVGSYEGQIADVRIWNRVRSQDEIQAGMRQRLNGDEEGLAGYWPLDDGVGTTARDLTANKNYGSLQTPTTNSSAGSALPKPPAWPIAESLVWDGNEINPEILGQFFINQSLAGGSYLGLAADKSNDTQTLNVMTPGSATSTPLNSDATFDRLHRFIRLAETLDWTFADADLALRSVQPAPETEINPQAIESLAAMRQLQSRLGLPVDELCALWSDVNTFGIGAQPGDDKAPQDLFDRTFNYPTSFADPTGNTGAPAYHPAYTHNPFYDQPVISWTPFAASQANQAPNPSLLTRGCLRAALQLKDTDLFLLTKHLLPPNADSTTILQLDVPMLSAFYRHSRLARALNLPMGQFLALIQLLQSAGEITAGQVWAVPNQQSGSQVKAVAKIVEWADWMRAAKVNVAQLAYLTTGKINPFVIPLYDPNAIQSWVEDINNNAQSVLLNKDSFASNSISDAQSAQIFQSLQAGEAIDAIGVVLKIPPPPVSDTPIESGDLSQQQILDLYVAAKLAEALAQQDKYVVQQLASFFNVSADLAAAALEFTCKSQGQKTVHGNQLFLDLAWEDAAVWVAACGLNLYLAQVFNLTPQDVLGMTETPAAFNLAKFGDGFKLTLQNLRGMTAYKKLCAGFDVTTQLLAYFKTPSVDALAEITGWMADQITELESQSFWPSGWTEFNTVEQVAALARCFSAAQNLGVDIGLVLGLRKLNPLWLGDANATPSQQVWDAYQTAAHQLSQVISATYGSAQAPQAAATIEASCEEMKRDVLVGYLLWELSFTYDDLKTTDDLYDFLLIDVDMSSAVQISPLKAGLNSLQLYAQTTQMNLEAEVANRIPRQWWAWMSHYRVWQANREIYLYPENYVNPELRKFKTPQFEQLESGLQQGSLTPSLVEGALNDYLEGLSAVANLEIVASYRAKVQKPDAQTSDPGVDTVFIFGRTRTQPATFYYRTLRIKDQSNPEKSVWTAWQQLNLSINAETITPVYAFNKLFVFWVEQTQKTVSVDNNTQQYQVTTADIKYSFQKLNRSWSPPQILEQGVVINANTSTTANNYVQQRHTNAPEWKQVRVLMKADTENIVILYGELLSSSPATFSKPVATGNLEIDHYNKMWYRSWGYAKELETSSPGHLTSVVPIWILSSTLVCERARLNLNPAFENYCTANIYEQDPGQLTYNQYKSIPPPRFAPSPVCCFPLTGTPITDIVSNSDVTWTSGDFSENSSCPLGATRDVLSVGTQNGFTATIPAMDADITVEVWLQITDTSSFSGYVLALANGSGGAYIVTKNSTGSYQISCGLYLDEIELGTITNQWVCLTITIDAASKKFSLYLNGEYSNYTNVSETLNVTSITLGSYTPVDELPQDGFTGSLAQVTVWNSLLSSDDIKFRAKQHQWVFPAFGVISAASLPLLDTGVSPYLGRFNATGNQSGWGIFDNGDEAFLVIPQGNPFKLTEDVTSMTVAESSDISLPIMTISYSDAATDPDNFDFSSLKLQFIRLTTHTVPALERALLTGGTDALLALKSQFAPELKFSRFTPSSSVVAPKSQVMNFNGAYGEYFWELFFYAPFLIANTFSANQRFQLAQKWYQYIFNPTQTAPTDGLVAYWQLNGNATDSVGGNDGTLGNKGTNFVEMKFADSSMRTVFNSSGSSSNSVSLGNPGDLNLTGTITLEGWSRFTSTGGDQCWIITKETDNVDGEWQSPWFVYRLCVIDGTFTFSLSINGEYQKIDSSSSPSYQTANLDEWYYVAGTYDGSQMRLYVNGQLISQAAVTGSINTSSKNAALGGDSFYGQLSGLGIWNRALSQAEVAERYAIKTPQDRFWRFRPFLEISADTIKDDLSNSRQIAVYEYDPFDPDAVARLRAGAYPKAMVMRYIANLLRWGNRLFAQYTWETLSEATMLYTEALDLLGPQPEQVGALPAPPTRTVEDFVKEYGTAAKIPDFLVRLENHLAYTPPGSAQQTHALPFNLLNSYFCVPVNRGLLALWREADNQLYKIRHGENIKGQPQQLSLYGAPLNPAALAKAGASSAAAPGGQQAGATTVPYYRFSYLIQQARDVTGQVSQLGSQLLGALEKQDAEQLAVMLNNNEATILNLTTQVKQNQIEQLQQAAQSLQAGLAAAQLRRQTYGAWLQGQSGAESSALSTSSSSTSTSGSDSAGGDWTQSLSSSEQTSLGLTYGAAIAHTEAAVFRTLSSAFFLLPDIFGLADGGMNFGGSVEAIAGTFDSIGGALGATSQLTSAVAQFQRRSQEWMLQYQLAGDDIEQIQAQLAANQTETASAQQDLQINQEQIAQNQAVGSFYQTKFTSQQLYQWMAGRLSTLYFQGYQLAFELAQQAQAAFQYENNSGKNFLDYGAWDSLEKGLTAADSLALGLSQLEKANIDAGIRHLEIEKTISLSQLDPQALVDLKQTGQCSFNLTEQLFDYDYPGQYNRKIATVSLTIPAIVGPYQNLHATLTQTANRIVTQPDINAVEYLLPGGTGTAPASIRSNWNVNQEIAISRGVNDSGLFVLNFDDPRYLPFEGTGAISSWTLNMPKASNAIDFNSISDVIVQLSYTAQDGGADFRTSVAGLPAIASFAGVRMLSLRQNFPEAWHLFKTGNAATPALQFPILRAMFPVNLEPGSVALGDSTTGEISVQWLVAKGDTTGLPSLTLNGQTVTNGSAVLVVPGSAPATSPVHLSDFGPSVKNSLTAGARIPEQVEDVVLIIPFTGDLSWN